MKVTTEDRQLPCNQILQGDCTKILRTLPAECIDLVITDPPYGVRYRDRNGRTIANDGDLATILGAFTDLYRALKTDSFCVSFHGWNGIDAFFDAWSEAGFRPVGHLVWRKNYASSSSYLRACHEQAYVLAKGQPPKRTIRCRMFERGSIPATGSTPPKRR